MQIRKKWLGAALAAALSAGTAQAGDLGEILRRKGVITEAELEQAREEEKKQNPTTQLPKWLDSISLFGDLRTRHEGFYAQDLNARNRFRLRARLGLTANVSDEVGATVRLASGNPDDPISTNQSFERAFTRKPINLDQAYLTLKPGKTLGLDPGWVTVTGGKFGVNAYRVSELIWDDDLSPEGATETVNLVEQRQGFLRGLKVNAFQWIVDELAAAGDPWMGGGQLVADTAFSDTTKWTLAFADYHYENLNGVARKFLSQNTTDSKDPTKSNANSSFNSQLANSNSLVRDANKNILGYRSRFNVIHGATELNSADPVGLGIPAGVFSDLAYNTQADGRNVGFYIGAGIGKAGKDWYHNSLKNVGDWGMSYTYARVEKDAVPSLFSFSDLDYVQKKATQKGSTNVSAHMVRLDYVLLPNLQLTAKAHLIDALDRKASNASLNGNPTLVRTQLDAVLKF
ncbi:MAG: putative porin [Deltaproteobacteria bacterium]|nr:putative porin [Deltaproteobacteria bacterium]